MKHTKSAGVFLLTVVWVAGILTQGRTTSGGRLASDPRGALKIYATPELVHELITGHNEQRLKMPPNRSRAKSVGGCVGLHPEKFSTAPIYLAEMISAVRSVTGPSNPDTSSGESLVQ